MKVLIARIKIDGSTQARAKLDPEHVERLKEAIDRGEALPPVELFDDGTDLWPWDGHHTIDAHKASRLTQVEANVQPGTQRDAILRAVGVNDTHGLPRTNEDKRHAVKMLLADAEWKDASDRWIAEKCRVSDRFVGSMRASNATANGSQSVPKRQSSSKNPEKRRGRDGRKTRVPNKADGPCARCLRIGSPSCAACKEKFPEGFPREPGSDDPDDKKPRAKSSRNGKLKYDWREWNKAWHGIVRQFDEAGKAYQDRDSPEFIRASRALDAFTESFKAWKERAVNL